MINHINHSKSFLLGIGAQKCGTTWLHSELEKSDQFDGGFTKEYHIFDILYASHGGGFLNRLHSRIQREISHARSGVNHGTLTSKRLSFLDNIDNYFDYFHYLLLRRWQVRLAADITPSYSVLDASALDVIKQGFAIRGIPLKVIFLMRDPVERAWSSARMNLRNKSRRNNDFVLTREQEVEFISKHCLRSDVVHRTRYDVTIENVEKVFNPESVFYGFYETMFMTDNLNRLTSFLGLSDLSFDPGRFYNSSPKNIDIPTSLIQKIKHAYQPVYNYISNKFGSESIKGWY